jgi:hypothetical protein
MALGKFGHSSVSPDVFQDAKPVLTDLEFTPPVITPIWLVKIKPLDNCELAGY